MDVFIINIEDKNTNNFDYLNMLREIYINNCEDYRVVICKNRHETIEKTLYYSTLNDVRYILSIGGNITLNSVINGMFLSKKPLIVIPCGNNNDLFNNLSTLNEDTEIDLGCVNDEYFFGSVSIGLDALISQKLSKLPLDKSSSYIKELLRISNNYNGLEIDMHIDGEEIKKKISLLSFYNAGWFGNNNIVPNTSLTDGKLNLFIANDITRIRLFYNLLKLWLSDYKDNKDIALLEVSNAHLKFDYPIIYTYDGITAFDNEINVSVEPKKILIKRDIDSKIKRLCDGKKCK